MAHAHPTACHGHDHGHGHHHHHHVTGNILLAFFLNLAFSIIELIGGLLTGSVAILSDALHDFGDAIALGMAWYLQRLSGKGSDQHFSYGYKRFSLLSALAISLFLLIGSLFVLYSAVGKLFNPGTPDAVGMMWIALLGLAVNGFAAWRMSGGHSLSERAIRLHLLEDVLGWLAVLVVSVVMMFVDLPILDPLLSIAIAGWILYNVYFNLRDTLRIFLQGVPDGIDTTSLTAEIEALPHVLQVHDLHLWTMNGQEHIGSLHIVYSRDLEDSPRERCLLKSEVRHIALHHGIGHLTIELDPEGESCGMEECCRAHV